MNKNIKQNDLDGLIHSFFLSLKALKKSPLVSMDFASDFKKEMSDPIKEYSKNNQVVIMMNINKIILCSQKFKNGIQYLIVRGDILNHAFRPFKIIFTRYVHYLKDNLILKKCYLFSNLRVKLLRRDEEKTKELTFKAAKTTQGFFIVFRYKIQYFISFFN